MISRLKFYLMSRSREQKYRQFFVITEPSIDTKLLDVGVADQEYSPFDNYFIKKYPYQNKITALSIHPLSQFKTKYPQVNSITYKGGQFPFKNNQFDIVLSNAVIEHVGDSRNQLFFINELKRVSRQFYFTTPAKECPIEMHTNMLFIHWLRKSTFDKIVSLVGKGWASGNYMNLLKKRDLKNLLKLSNVSEYKILTHKLGPFPIHYAVWGR